MAKRQGNTLEEWRDTITEQVPLVNRAPYSHNIISTALRAISEGWGKPEANKAVRELGLKRLGWHEESCDYCNGGNGSEDLRECQLRSSTRDKRWQYPKWICKTCREYLTGAFFRYYDPKKHGNKSKYR